MNDEKLIWEAYEDKNFELNDIKTLNRLLRRYYPNSRVVLSNAPSIRQKKPVEQGFGIKPNGLWYGIGNEWADFIEKKMPEWSKDYVAAFVIEVDESSVLTIDNEALLESLDDEYGDRREGIKWWKVQEELGWSGVEIIPHQKGYAEKYWAGWYSYWDIASGCIWDMSCITKITKIFPREKPQADVEAPKDASRNEFKKLNTIYIDTSTQSWNRLLSNNGYSFLRAGLDKNSRMGEGYFNVLDQDAFTKAQKQYNIEFEEVTE